MSIPGISDNARRALQTLALALVLAVALPMVAHGAASVNITAAETHDSPANGHLDSIVVTFSADPGAVDASGFLVDGYTVTGVTGSGTTRTLALQELAAYDTGAKPAIHFTDAAGTSDFASTDAAYKDLAAPVLVRASGDDAGQPNVFKDAGDALSLQFSESGIALYLNPTSVPQNAAASTPALTAGDKHLALEQAFKLEGPNPACQSDGNGALLTGNGGGNGSNFPSVFGAPSTDPISVAGDTITVTMQTGNSPSTNGNFFSIRPETTVQGAPLAVCRASLDSLHFANILDGAKNLSTVTAVHPLIVLQRGLLTSAPATADLDVDGRIDQLTLTFNHPIDPDSVTAVALSRFSIVDAVDPSVKATNLSFPANAVSNSTLKVTFAPPAGWSTASTPLVTYDDSGTCLATGIRIIAPATDKQCAQGFTQVAVDKAAPVALGASTLDANSDGSLDGVRLGFSEPVKKDSVKFEGFAITDASGTALYTPSGISTPSGADDPTVDVTFSPTGGTTGDTAVTPRVSYTAASGSASDAAGNLIADFANLQTIDGAAPVFMEGGVYDVMAGTTGGSHDGKVDEATFRFSEPIKDGSIVPAKFHIGALNASAFKASPLNTADPKVANDVLVTMVVDGGVIGTDAKTLAVDAGAVADTATQARLAVAKTIDKAQIADNAGPVAMTITPTGQSTASKTMTITFSEPMDVEQGLTVSYKDDSMAEGIAISGDTTESHNAGWRTDEAANGMIWDGTVPAPEAEQCQAVAGCKYTISIAGGKDAAGKDQAFAPDTRFLWTIDTIEPATPVISAPTVNQVLTTNGTVRNVTVSGTAGETGLTIRVANGSNVVQTTTSSASGHPWSVTLPNLALGSYSVTVTAIDAGTNQSDPAMRPFSVKRTTLLTIARSKDVVVYGQPVTLAGTLKNGSGQVMPSTPVKLQAQRYGTTTWSTIANLTTNSSGAYSFAYTPSASMRFRTVYLGTSTLAPATSPVVGTLVRVALSLRQTTSRMALGQTMVVYGSVRPGHAGKYMRLQQWTGSAWKTVTTVRLDQYSNYRFNVRPGARGTYKYRVYYLAQDADHYDNWAYANLSVY